jgi:hypothetical protein
MDVTRTKDQKLFSLGKKFAQLTADCKKLRATTRTFSSRLDTDSMHDPKLTWASGESETKGKAGKES